MPAESIPDRLKAHANDCKQVGQIYGDECETTRPVRIFLHAVSSNSYADSGEAVVFWFL